MRVLRLQLPSRRHTTHSTVGYDFVEGKALRGYFTTDPRYSTFGSVVAKARKHAKSFLRNDPQVVVQVNKITVRPVALVTMSGTTRLASPPRPDRRKPDNPEFRPAGASESSYVIRRLDNGEWLGHNDGTVEDAIRDAEKLRRPGRPVEVVLVTAECLGIVRPNGNEYWAKGVTAPNSRRPRVAAVLTH
jgi:hypothetical protein